MVKLTIFPLLVFGTLIFNIWVKHVTIAVIKIQKLFLQNQLSWGHVWDMSWLLFRIWPFSKENPQLPIMGLCWLRM